MLYFIGYKFGNILITIIAEICYKYSYLRTRFVKINTTNIFMQRRLQWFWVVIMALCTTPALAQEAQTALVKGRLLNKSTLQPANDVQITIPNLKLLATSDGQGEFVFSRVPYGTHMVVVGGTTVVPDTFRILVNTSIVDLKEFSVTTSESAASQATQQIPTIALEESDVSSDDDGVKASNVSGVLTASRDPFLNTAGFVLGQYRFRLRGYDNGSSEVQINGAPMNDIETGDAYWSQWGGLNDVFKGRNLTYGLKPSEYAYGGIGGSTYFDATAANQRKQTRVTYSLTNRQYRNRLMLTHSTGLLKNGWAFSLSASKRWANEGYVDGTFYDGYSYYAGVSKRFNSKSTLNLTAFGAPTRRGKSAPSYQEANDLSGSNFYNPNWGYQNGEKRNAKVANVFQPTFLLNYEYTPSDKMRWNTVVGYQFGKNANSTLDWYNAPDPRPDYYRNLPSYYQFSTPPDPYGQGLQTSYFPQSNQINWDDLYQTNYMNRRQIPGTLDSGRRSLYIVGSDVDDIKKWIFNTNMTYVLNEHMTLNTGLSFINQQTESYRRLDDLLGGDYFLNINSFSERNFAAGSQNTLYNVNDPNLVVKEGDKYYYDYMIRFRKAVLWEQLNFTFNKVDFFIAGNGGFNSFQREGLYRNGLFADGNASFGRGIKQNFAIYGIKGGITYKLNGRNYLFANAGLSSDAPTVDNTYFASRIRNRTVDNPENQMTYTFEGGYLLRSPKVNARVVGYVTDVEDETKVQRFYYTGSGGANNFVDYVLRDLNSRFIGTELALDYKVNANISLTGVASLGQAFYTSNATVTKYEENTTDTGATYDVAYTKGHYLAVGPQSVYSLGINYRSKNYWYAGLNANYLDRMYVEIAAPRRTAEALDLVVPESDQWHSIVDQERLPSAFTFDLNVGKSFLLSKINKKIPRNTYLYINAGVSNLLDNKNVRTGGFENLRYDFSGGEAGKFQSKYFYAFGRNFFINISLKF